MNPEPVNRDDGGTDYRMPECQGICYSVDEEGYCVTKCERLVVGLGSMKCEKLLTLEGDYEVN